MKQKRPLQCQLEMTLEDYKKLGSLPPQSIIQENPGKRLVDLMTDRELIDHLNELKAKLDKLADKSNFDNVLAQNIFYAKVKDYNRSIEFLQSIDHLPKGFERYDVAVAKENWRSMRAEMFKDRLSKIQTKTQPNFQRITEKSHNSKMFVVLIGIFVIVLLGILFGFHFEIF